MNDLLRLKAMCEMHKEYETYVNYMKRGFMGDFVHSLARAKMAYGDEADAYLARDGEALRDLIDDFSDVSLGAVVGMLAAMISKLNDKEK
jgi:hypothetical protein